MQVRWNPDAKIRLSEIYLYYKEQFGVVTAQKVKNSIKACVTKLKLNPFLGKIEPDFVTLTHTYRSLVEHKNHKIIYYVEDEVLYIVDIWPCNMNPRKIQSHLK